ncbi:hypothetical protein LEP48_16340 [Isoptericola sp. NEAU-Y5]|uniref:Uncharacterized protein n=1 Tax=Isoptericola luteus TaxID=2879484 RepID=A0ABS7ZKK5_9MICO|nr:hypothetical protein [Isoptericola sp. NEAU-Y5]
MPAARVVSWSKTSTRTRDDVSICVSSRSTERSEEVRPVLLDASRTDTSSPPIWSLVGLGSAFSSVTPALGQATSARLAAGIGGALAADPSEVVDGTRARSSNSGSSCSPCSVRSASLHDSRCASSAAVSPSSAAPAGGAVNNVAIKAATTTPPVDRRNLDVIPGPLVSVNPLEP